VDRAVSEGLVEAGEAAVWAADHRVQLTPEQQARVEGLLQEFRRAPYTTPSVSECVERLGEELFHSLLENGTLVRISPDVVYLAGTLGEMREQVVDLIRTEGSATVAQVRDLLGASRKYIVALMEHLDQQRVTRRVGDARVLREH
jgi:selenocysteine-specific elongation factor